MDFFDAKVDLDDLNHTFIVMIPKIKKPISMTNFRAISLRNSLYKIISKIICNRLKRVLMDLIDPSQSSFIPGRLITDNVIVAHECFNQLHNHTGPGGNCMDLKIDMKKAYDRIEWDYLDKILQCIGFPH